MPDSTATITVKSKFNPEVLVDLVDRIVKELLERIEPYGFRKDGRYSSLVITLGGGKGPPSLPQLNVPVERREFVTDDEWRARMQDLSQCCHAWLDEVRTITPEPLVPMLRVISTTLTKTDFIETRVILEFHIGEVTFEWCRRKVAG